MRAKYQKELRLYSASQYFHQSSRTLCVCVRRVNVVKLVSIRLRA
jgi:hypothetical protein